MANIDAIRDKAIRAVDRVMAEDLALFFLVNSRADPSRTNLTTRGVLRTGSGRGDTVAGRGVSWAARIAAGRAEAHIDRATYAGPPIRKGDKLRAVERPGQPWFEILDVNDRGESRLVLNLGEA